MQLLHGKALTSSATRVAARCCFFSSPGNPTTYLQLHGFSRHSCRADAHAFLISLLKSGNTDINHSFDVASGYSRLRPIVDKRAMPTGSWMVEFSLEDEETKSENVNRVLRGHGRKVGGKRVTISMLSSAEARTRLEACRVSAVTWGSIASDTRTSNKEGGNVGESGREVKSPEESATCHLELEAPLTRVMNLSRQCSVADLEYLLRDFDINIVARVPNPKSCGFGGGPFLVLFASEAEAHRAYRELNDFYTGMHGKPRLVLYK